MGAVEPAGSGGELLVGAFASQPVRVFEAGDAPAPYEGGDINTCGEWEADDPADARRQMLADEWDQTRSYCPYHQGVLDGHDRAFGDLSQAAIAFQVDPELMDTVLDARSRQKVYEYRALQREANKPEPEGLSEYEKEVRDVVHELDPRDR